MIDSSQLCSQVKKGACEEHGYPLGEPSALSNIKNGQKEESNEDRFEEEVHLYLSSIFSYLLKFLLLDLEQHDRFVDNIAKMNLCRTASYAEYLVCRTGALELEVGLLLAVCTLGHLE